MAEIPNIEAYRAMFFFLEQYFERGDSQSSELANILSSMSLLEDGHPSDPAFLDDWIEALEKAKSTTSIYQELR